MGCLIITLAVVDFMMIKWFASLYPTGDPIGEWISKVAFPSSCLVFCVGLKMWTSRNMLSFEHKNLLLCFGFFFGTCFGMTLAYILILPLNFQLTGYYIATAVAQVSSIFMIYAIANTDFTKFKGTR